jgi:hypothetical protein
VRTVIAPLPREVQAQIDALDRRLAGIARRYIRRLALEPQLGAPVCRGPLAGFGVRRVYFDSCSVPGDLLRSRAPAARRPGPRRRAALADRLLGAGGAARPPAADRRPRRRRGPPTTARALRLRTRVDDAVGAAEENAMTVYLVARPAYHQGMDDGLPHPTEALTLAEIEDERERVLETLEKGGAVIVYSNDRQLRLGVLTRDPAVLGDAQVAQLIDAGHLPPIAELLAMDDRGELP